LQKAVPNAPDNSFAEQQYEEPVQVQSQNQLKSPEVNGKVGE
jgi:hypothetical protein